MLSLHLRGSGRTRVIAGIAAILSASSIPTLVHAGDSATLTPIKHVIIIIGENRTFDHVYREIPGRALAHEREFRRWTSPKT